ncbi:MAG: hypothetical protein KDJ52_25955, partial [Anaerolineae bacterium]|nr:hypothetical protein [Anaerolineae bacterium]
MSRKIVFEDGSAIEVATEIVTPGEMATDAYRRLMDFIEAELVEADQTEEEDLSDLDEEDFEDLDEEELDFDDDDMEDEDLWE